MLAQPLRQSINNNLRLETNEGHSHQYAITDHGYGKDAVKILHVKRDGPVHTIREFEVDTHLKLYTRNEYRHGNNSDIIDSDSLKNTVYLLAKKHGIENPEKFALLLAKHFLNQYPHVEEASIHVDEYPWQRISQEESTVSASDNKKLGQPHNHAFVYTPTVLRFCDVILRRNDPKQTVIGGIKGLRVLKTTQSTFTNFFRDEYSLLSDIYDRIYCTVVDARWEYSNTDNLNFCQAWNTVKNIIIKNIAGDPKVGILSTSTQHTLYLTEKEILDVIPQVSVISMNMPTQQYLNFDTKPFQNIVPGDNNEVFVPADKPNSIVYAQLARDELVKNHL